MNEYYAILAGVLIRIAIPLLVLLGLALLLGRMDARWKRESQSLRQGRDLTVISNGTAACWDVKGCSPEKIAACPVKNSDESCWQVFRQENGDFDPNCLNCDVFLTSVAPVPEIVTTSH
jgi:hypothetical protein